jgi:transketolase
MPAIDSMTGEIIREYSIDELCQIAKRMRSYAISAISIANSGHTGGVMSVIEILTALYFSKLNHDPKIPDWEDRDRLFLSAGHKAPALYAALGLSGYFDVENIIRLRSLNSGFEGHPNKFKLPGIEASSGSLGQGLGIALGSALSARLKKKNYRVYCIMGDGELDEGSVWEAAMAVSHHNLDNVTAIIDRNFLQIDGLTKDVMDIEPLSEKWISFGWEVFECDGHNISDILDAFNNSEKIRQKPSVIIAKTVKGKSIRFAERVCGYHGIPPKNGLYGSESLETALADIGCEDFDNKKIDGIQNSIKDYRNEITMMIDSLVPKFSKNYFWNAQETMKAEMIPNRTGFGNALEKIGEDQKVVALGADITDSIKMSSFYLDHPDRKNRFFSMGIAEQNMTTVAAGLAKEGFIPYIGSYGIFITGRNWDQLRTTVCYNNFNVKIVDAHGGISVGPDGATHQALEDISNLYYLPNMKMVVPADSIEAFKATVAINNLYGPAAIRIAREATPVVTKKDTPFEFGVANIIRYRGKKEKFEDAFEVVTSKAYKNEKENITLIGNGPVIAEAMRAAYILKEEFNIETRVINMHTVKPPDTGSVIKAADETGAIITIEEHQKGGFGNIIAGIALMSGKTRTSLKFDMMGIEDRFGESGQPWELMKLFGLTSEFIVQKVLKCLQAS